jgi:predicted P-loop ATPase
MLKHALLYAQFGWAVFPISNNTKIPFAGTHGCKDASKKDDEVVAMFEKYRDCNIGVATGAYSGIVVIDIDNKNGGSGEIALEALEAKYGKLPETVEAFTPSGGRHLFFKAPVGIRISNSTNNLGQYLDVRGDGGYVLVAPSSIDGKEYSFEVEHSPFVFQLADCPQWLLALIQESKRDYDINLGEKDRVIKEGARDERLFEIAKVARNSGLTDQASLYAYLQGVNINNCRPPLDEKVVMKIVNSILSYEDRKAEAVVKGEVLIWDKTDGGAFRTTYRNCLNFLKTDEKLLGLFRYNEFVSRTILTRKPFWLNHWRGEKTLSDEDLLEIKQHLTTLNFQPSLGLLMEAVQSISLANKFHPVRDYFDSLTWDKTPRVDTFLSTYFEAKDTPYTRFVSKLMLCAAIKRILHPGIKYDYLVILEGDQGIGKSRGIQALAGEFFSEITLYEHDKDLIDKMQGKWILEVSELDVFKKRDVESLKSFLAIGIDRVRMSYARNTSSYPRQCIFLASYNPDGMGYFRDFTGNRRFLPVSCGKVNVSGIKDNRDQLFAEAMELEKEFNLYVPDDIDKDAIAEQEMRLVVDAWEPYIEKWLEDPMKEPEGYFTISDVWSHALNGMMDRITRAEQIRIAHILQKMGFKQKSQRYEGTTRRVYYREKPLEQSVEQQQTIEQSQVVFNEEEQ